MGLFHPKRKGIVNAHKASNRHPGPYLTNVSRHDRHVVFEFWRREMHGLADLG